MAMSMGSSGSSIGDMNVTPMIDILLVLLVIFMIIVPQVRHGLAADVPQPPRHQQQQVSQRTIVVQILYHAGRAPTFKVNDTVIDNGAGGPAAEQDLLQELTNIYANRAQRVMFVKADGDVNFQSVADVISIGKAAGVNHVGLLTPDMEAAAKHAG